MWEKVCIWAHIACRRERVKQRNPPEMGLKLEHVLVPYLVLVKQEETVPVGTG
jgi:hypothetical protein